MARFADTHLHTNVSPCAAIGPRDLLARALELKLDCLVITDHNTTAGARAVLEHQAADPRYLDIEVVVGVELNTEFGEIAVIYLDGEDADAIETLREGRHFPLEAVLATVARRRGAGKQLLTGLVHPFSSGPRGAFRFADLLRATAPACTPAEEDAGRYVDVGWWLDVVGVPASERDEFDSSAVAALFALMEQIDYVEVFNGANLRPAENRKAAALARVFKKPGLCGSDAHFLRALGACRTEYYGATLREAILAREVQPDVGRFVYPRAALFRAASGFRKHLWHRLPGRRQDD